MKQARTKLLLSLVSLLLSVSLLIGSTFAWFTDSASTGVNKIQAGNLDIQLLDAGGQTLEGGNLEWVTGVAGQDQSDILWEPGAVYALEPFTIKNDGNLALKYQVAITSGVTKNAQGVTATDVDLLDVIDFYVVEGDGAVTSRDVIANAKTLDAYFAAKGALIAGGSTPVLNIVARMQESAGNEYQGLQLDGMAITVYAAQDTVESDSFGTDYDDAATLPVHVTGQDAMTSAFNAPVNGNVNVALAPGTDVELESKSGLSTVVITGDASSEVKPKPVTGGSDYPTVYFDNADVVFDGITIDGTGNNWNSGGVCARGGSVVYKNCTINGSIGQVVADSLTLINCTFNQTREEYVACLYDVKETLIEDCTFNTNGKALMVYSSGEQKVVIRNCTATDTSSTAKKAFVELCDDWGNCKYDVVIDGCTVTGYEVTGASSKTWGGTSVGTSVWGNKNYIPAERLSVVVDGVKAY